MKIISTPGEHACTFVLLFIWRFVVV